MSKNSSNGNHTTRLSTRLSTRDIGQRGEDRAARFLQKQGLVVIARNVRCRGGEIDLVCRHGKSLVFVEVRLRRSAAYGGAAASITACKQRRIVLAARHYLAAHASADCDCRFDCVLIEGDGDNAIVWERDAFAAPVD